MTLNYNFELRPHHVNALVNFYKNKLYNLSDDEYIESFRLKNKDWHNDEFIIKWKHFLEKLCNSLDLRFLYVEEFDSGCVFCDLRKECEDKSSQLRGIVDSLDKNSFDLFDLEYDQVYKIRDVLY